jgi:hypothetical protein
MLNRYWCWCWLNAVSRAASFRPCPFCPSARLPADPQLRFLFLPAAAIALVAQFAVLWAVIAGRAPASSPGRQARLAEIAWVVLPTLVLIAVLLFTWNRMAEPMAVAPVAGVTA